jgi:hypothetical protein
MNMRLFFTVLFLSLFLGRGDSQTVNYYLTFSARPAVASKLQFGHAFVSWNIEDEDEDELIFSKTVGFFPQNTISPLNSPGVLKEGWKTNSTDNPEITNFTVEVDKKVFFETLKLREKWKKKNYKMLSGEACTDFMNDVAKKAGLLALPEITYTTKYPPSYLLLLIERNKEREVSPPVMPKDAIPKKKKNKLEINYRSSLADSSISNVYLGVLQIPFDVLHGTVSVKKFVGTVKLNYTTFPKGDTLQTSKGLASKNQRYRYVVDMRAGVLKGKELQIKSISIRFYKGITARKLRKKSEGDLEKFRVKDLELDNIMRDFNFTFQTGEKKTWSNKSTVKGDLRVANLIIEVKRK